MYPIERHMPKKSRDPGLSASEIERYFEIGWVTRRMLFSAREIERMRTCFDALEDIASRMPETGLHRGSYFVLGERMGTRVIERIVWAGGCAPHLLEVGSDPRLTLPCTQLLGSDTLDQLLSQAHFKHPRDGVVFDWHQDIRHRDKHDGTWIDVDGRGSFVQTVIALDEITPDSGPLLFVPGSSRWGPIAALGPDADASESHADCARFCERHAEAMMASPGDVLFFGPYTVHASFENRSERPRRVLINGYASPGANRRVYPGVGTGRRLMVTRTGTTPLHS